MAEVARRLRGTRAGAGIALAVLLVASAVLRTRAIDAGYWIDEGLSVGIASHPLADIPGLLRQDGSPPLYYALLSLWTGVFGDGETATHALSLTAALAAIPAALWAGRALFGTRAGWAAAAIVATTPALTAFAQETRMYALLALLSLLASATFVLGFVHGRRGALIAFVPCAALLAYTHNWGLFLLLGLACALPVAVRARGPRPVARDVLLAGGAALLAYAPWIPTLLDQAEHTGAPWSTIPPLEDAVKPVTVPLGQGLAATIVLAGAAIGLVRAWRSGAGRGAGERPAPGAGAAAEPDTAPEPGAAPSRTAATALIAAVAVAGGAAFAAAQLEPGWDDRYMSVFVGPVALLAGAGLAAAGRAGMAALAAVVILWAVDAPPERKSNARTVARAMAPLVERGDLIVVTHPEQVAVLRHYSRDGLRWATSLGPVPDPRVFDWRDATNRLEAAQPRATLDRLLATKPHRLVLVRPLGMRRGGPEWLDLVALRAGQWSALLGSDPRLAATAAAPENARRRGNVDLEAVVYELRAP